MVPNIALKVPKGEKVGVSSMMTGEKLSFELAKATSMLEKTETFFVKQVTAPGKKEKMAAGIRLNTNQPIATGTRPSPRYLTNKDKAYRIEPPKSTALNWTET
jgi:hypothetical protein